jgi:hypothetical protein
MVKHTMGHYSAMKSELLIHLITWINLQVSILHEKQTEPGMVAIPTLKKLKQKGHKFKASWVT